MAPPLQQRFGSGPNSMAHYQQYSSQMGGNGHNSNLPPPGSNSFMAPNTSINPFTNPLALGQGFGGGGGRIGVAGGTGLESHEAQARFERGGNLQQGTSVHGQGARNKAGKGRIRDVWKSNLQEEMHTLRSLVDRYPYISMDTEFPGLVARPMGAFRGKSDYHYQTLRANVDLLKLIQLGITLFTEDGDMTPPRPQSSDSGIDMNMPGTRGYGKNSALLPCTWQFNFSFSLSEDMYSEASIQSLTEAGVDFQRHETNGIDPHDFGALLISSGMVCEDDVHWISFHGGYDFGYLTKLLYCRPLPDDEVEFDKVMKKFFPSIYDVKYLMKHAIKVHNQGQVTPLSQSTIEVLQKFDQKSSLESLVEIFKIERMGRQHQGGSDAYVTGKLFFEIKKKIFNDEIAPEHLNCVWGLGYPEHVFVHSTSQQYANTAENSNSTPVQNGTGAPSTPNNAHAGLVSSTPAHSSVGGTMTPGGGVFGNFTYK